MINKLIKILEDNSKITDWKIHETYTVSEELFFIRRSIDMNRSKSVGYLNVSVYVKVSEGEETFTGVATGKIHPTMSVEEVNEAIDDLAFNAQFAKNKQFEIGAKSDNIIVADINDVKQADLSNVVNSISDQIYTTDVKGALLNSAEVFVNKIYHRIINSKGVDVSYISDSNIMEIITESSGVEEVELFELYEFAGEKGEGVDEIVKQQLEVTKYRAIAEKMAAIKDVRIILRAMEVKELLKYYVGHSNAQLIYDHISDNKVGDKIQGDNVKGDTLSIKLVPSLENSTKSRPVDSDGVELKDVQIIKNGELLAVHGSNQFTSYLNQPQTGLIDNFVIEDGSMSYEEMTKQPYFEILSFSAFQANMLNGDFGGEIRLAKYFDGKEVSYLNGGALSANIKEVQGEMYLSIETIQLNEYKGPRSLMFVGDIAGAK